MDRRIIIIAVVAILVFGGLLIVPALLSRFNAGMSLQFYDPNGDPVGGPVAFVRSGQIVVSFDVKVTYSATVGSAGQVSDFSVTGTITVTAYLNTMAGGQAGSASTGLSSSEHSGEFVENFPLNFIQTDSTGERYGWVVVVHCALKASATLDGKPSESTWSAEKSFTLSWQDGSIVLEGGLVV